MYFLTKASIESISENPVVECSDGIKINLLKRYKDYEIFLTKESLKDFYDNKENCLENIKNNLKLYDVSIKAIHCPASLFLTSSDENSYISTNYLSLDEVLCKNPEQEESFEILKETIILADKISSKDNSVVVILHAGSINGCNSEDKLMSADDSAIEALIEKLVNLETEFPVRIAVENVTPYVDDKNNIPTGMNDGWGESYLDYMHTLKKLNKKLKEIQVENNILFGVCVDFCHLIADFRIMPDKCFEAKTCCDYISAFMKKLKEEKINIMLFHISMLNDNGSHGGLFRYDNICHIGIIETIKSRYSEYPDIPVTIETACENFDNMVYTFSVMHKSGLFGYMLDDEMKEFFDNLFLLYSLSWKDMDKLKDSLNEIKTYILKNNQTGGLADFFGFSNNNNASDMASIRVKAYIAYTRFCNLGKYLAEVYHKANFLSDKKENFSRSMKYFMFFDDEICQCVYTGVGYAFNMDFLPKTEETVYRFYDGIDEKQITALKLNNISEKHYFSQMIESIREQIHGTSLTMFSCGKNFFPCLMKYYQPDNRKSDYYSLRIYKNLNVNYIEVNENEKLSIPAFLHKYCYVKEKTLKKIHFVIDISVFRKGRGKNEDNSDTIKGKSKNENNIDTGTLSGFMQKMTDKGIILSTVGSISDGEIVATKLPEYTEYNFSLDEALGLVQVCKEYKNKKPVKSIVKNGKTVDVSTINELKDIIRVSETEIKDVEHIETSYSKRGLPEEFNNGQINIEIERDDENVRTDE